MSLHVRELLPRLGRACRLGVALPIVVSLAIGCATAPRDEVREDAVPVAELHAEQARHQKAEAELRDQADAARTDLELLQRESARNARDLEAARASTQDLQVALDAAMDRVREQEQELAELRTLPASANDVGAAAELLRQLKKDNDLLRQKLAQAEAGEGRPAPDPALEGRIKPADMDLQVEIASVDGEPVTRRDFVEFLYRDLGTPALLELCVNRVLVEREARRRRIEVSDVECLVWIQEQLIQHVRQAGSDEAFEKKITEAGFDRASWAARLSYQARPALLLRRLAEVERTTPEGREAFERRLREEYEATYSERVTASHIYVRVDRDADPEEVEAARQKAANATSLVRRGVSYVDVARRLSQDPETAKLGGTLGTFNRSRFERTPELNQAFFSLDVGKVSDPIRSPLGFHVVLVEERTDAVRPFDAEVRSELLGRLSKQPPADSELEALIARLRARANVTRNLVFDEPASARPR